MSIIFNASSPRQNDLLKNGKKIRKQKREVRWAVLDSQLNLPFSFLF
jgi:hypothetical protein